MKILINAISARTGGIVTYTNNLARSLAERNVDATFAVSRKFSISPDIQAIKFPADAMSPIQRTIWEQTIWRHVVSAHKPDILFSSANFGLLATSTPQILLVREGGLFDPYYLTNIAPNLKTSAIFSRLARRNLIIASARASKIILTPSETMKNLLLYWAEDLADRIYVNQYGTIPMFYDQIAHTRQWREGGVLKILYISAYYPHKQPGLLAESVADLNTQGIPCKATFTMDLEQIDKTVGGEKDYILLKKGVERGQINLIGTQVYKSLPDIYKSHDLFVFPSLSETFGHPLVEAMGIGIPIVASDTPIHREVCKNSALYFSPQHPSDLVRKIKRLDKENTLRKSNTNNGREYVNKHFMWESHIDRLLDSFEQAINM